MGIFVHPSFKHIDVSLNLLIQLFNHLKLGVFFKER